MKSTSSLLSLLLPILAICANTFAGDSAFTYQGRLTAGATPANGQYEMSFTLYDAATNGNAIGSQTVASVAVTNGLFTATLDFGSDAFNGASRWLEISVNLFGSDMIPTRLVPRQKITPTPHAIHAASAGNLAGSGNTAVEIQVNGARALRIEPTAAAPNLIGGFPGNGTSSGVVGSFIGGGGLDNPDHGPSPNRVYASYSAIVGGIGNTVNEGSAFMGGGQHNWIATGAYAAVMGGGVFNQIQLNAHESFLGGGLSGLIDRESAWSVLSGGYYNSIGFNSPLSTISGGMANRIGPEAQGSVIAGGGSNQIEEGASYSFIGGGRDNIVHASAGVATISGGEENAIFSGATFATVAGGEDNMINALASHASVGGGFFNIVQSNSSYSVIAGGAYNSVASVHATIAGGFGNTNRGNYATIPGGRDNLVQSDYSFAAGRRAQARHQGAFVWADSSNFDFASSSQNEWAVRATGGARFVSGIDSNGSNSFGVTLAPGSGAWSTLSDRNAKENVLPVDSQAILEKVAALPMATWNYKAQGNSIRHMGPMAQDFSAAFNLGENNRTITTVDADGVALAAIQGLHQKVEAENKQLRSALRSREATIADLQERLSKIEALLPQLQQSRE